MRITYRNLTIELIGRLNYKAPSADWSIYPHSHLDFEVHFVVTGEGVLELPDGELALVADTLYIAPPLEVHAQRSDPSAPLGLYHFGMQLYFHDGKPRGRMPRIYGSYPQLNEAFASIVELDRSSEPADAFRMRLQLIELLWVVIGPELLKEREPRGVDGPTAEQAGGSGMATPRYVDEAVRYVQQHFLEQPGIERIAAYCGIAPRHLTRLFAQQMNVSIQDYVQYERYMWAAFQLRTTSLSVQTISEMLHFGNAQYFGQWFKKIVGLSPSDYRKTNRTSGWS